MHVKLPSRFFMAPIAEITHAAFRKTVRKFSADTVLYSEMLSAASVVKGGSKNIFMTKTVETDMPFVYQLLGNDAGIMSRACDFLVSRNECMGIDINMGCSAPDIIKKKSGSFLLHQDNFGLSRDIVSKCRSALGGKNLSVKIRSGYPEHDSKHLLEFCRMLESEGADYISVHPRTGKQAFKRTADWNITAFLKSELGIPVIGNGDVKSAETALKRLAETGCDGIMIGRQAVQQPWIFALCGGRDEIEIDLFDTAEMTVREIERSLPVEYHKSRMHRFLAYYFKNLKFGHSAFPAVRASVKAGEMIAVLEDYFRKNPAERNVTYLKSGKRKDLLC